MGERDPKWKNLRDIPIPSEFKWLWKHFLIMWRESEYDFNGNVIFTFGTVNDYVECMKVPFTVEDKKYLFKMKNWALETIYEVKDKKE